MQRFRTQAAKESLLRRVRKQRLNYITILPSLVTILNGVCGFAAIVFASKVASPQDFDYIPPSPSNFVMAGYMILLAMVADMLDGRLARMSKTTSSFGGQLDSLCDVISFGLAPAFLMLTLLNNQLGELITLNSTMISFAKRFLWLTAAAYISCAAIRLARFNVENEEDEASHMSFVGLPTPAAAGVIVSLIIFQQDALPKLFDENLQFQRILENIILYSLPFITLGTSILMVSRIRYPHIINHYIRGKKPFAHFIRALLFLALVIIGKPQTALALIFCGFAISGVVKWLYLSASRHKYSITPESPLPSDSEL